MNWQCIVCEKSIEIISPGNDVECRWPNMAGGTVDIHFGYGSEFDFMDDCSHEESRCQACICDECFKDKKSLTRKVRICRYAKWEIIDE